MVKCQADAEEAILRLRGFRYFKERDAAMSLQSAWRLRQAKPRGARRHWAKLSRSTLGNRGSASLKWTLLLRWAKCFTHTSLAAGRP